MCWEAQAQFTFSSASRNPAAILTKLRLGWNQKVQRPQSWCAIYYEDNCWPWLSSPTLSFLSFPTLGSLGQAEALWRCTSCVSANTTLFQWGMKIHFAYGIEQLVLIQLTLQSWAYFLNTFKQGYWQQRYRIIKIQWKLCMSPSEMEQLTE